MTTPHGPFLLWALTKEEDLILATGGLVGVLLVGGLIFAKVDRWRKRQMEDRGDEPTGRLGTFREMYERGELSKEEYDRVLLRIAERAKAKATAEADRERRRLAGLAGPDVRPAKPPESGPPADQDDDDADDEKPPEAPPG
jgi:hypothetical protein